MILVRQASVLLLWAALFVSRGLFAQRPETLPSLAHADEARVALRPVELRYAQPVMPLLLRPITTATSTRLVNFRPTPAPAGETWNIEQWDLSGQ